MRKRNRLYYDESESAPELRQTPAEKFRTGTFLVVIDSLDAELRKKCKCLHQCCRKVWPSAKVRRSSSRSSGEKCKMSARSIRPNDLEASLLDKLVQCLSFLNTEFAKNALELDTATTTLNSSIPTLSFDLSLSYLVSNNLETVFPNTVIAFRIYLNMMVLNCSGERSFSKLKLLKNLLPFCMTQGRLNSLAQVNNENNVLRNRYVVSDYDFALPVKRIP